MSDAPEQDRLPTPVKRRSRRLKHPREGMQAHPAAHATPLFTAYWWQQVWPYAVLVTAVVLWVYARSIGYGFVNFQDPVKVTQNPFLNPPTAAGFRQFWSTAYDGTYVPLTYSMFWVEKFFGGEPWLLHLHNVLLHLASALLVFGILRRVTESFAFEQALPLPVEEARKLAAAAMGAIVFACHPAQAEAVAWVSARQELLSGCMALGAIYAYLIAAGPPVDLRGLPLQQDFNIRGRSYAMALVFFLAALMASLKTAVLPVVVLGINWLLLRRPLRKCFASLLPWFAVAGIWLILSLLGAPEPDPARPTVDWWRRPLVAADSLVFYFRLMLWPRNLVVIYPRNLQEVANHWVSLADLVAIIALVVATIIVAARKNYRVFPSLMVLFAVPLLPVIGLVPYEHHATSTVANRFLYLSLLSLAVIYAWMWLAATSHPHARARRSLGAGLVLVTIGHALSQTPTQVRTWRSTRTLWEHQAKTAPEALLPPQGKATVVELQEVAR